MSPPAATIQFGLRPRPVQVCEDLSDSETWLPSYPALLLSPNSSLTLKPALAAISASFAHLCPIPLLALGNSGIYALP
jgi:hypothetical protein